MTKSSNHIRNYKTQLSTFIDLNQNIKTLLEKLNDYQNLLFWHPGYRFREKQASVGEWDITHEQS